MKPCPGNPNIYFLSWYPIINPLYAIFKYIPRYYTLYPQLVRLHTFFYKEHVYKKRDLQICTYGNTFSAKMPTVWRLQTHIIYKKKIVEILPDFSSLAEPNKFVFLLSNKESRLLTWVGKFIFEPFLKRDAYPSERYWLRCHSL